MVYLLVDTPLSESRFSDYLQGWVDEVREEEHHSEPAFGHDDHDHDDDDDDDHNPIVPNEPYPEEHDDSTPDETEEAEQELKAEAESIKNALDDDDDDDKSDEVPTVQEPIREKRQIVEEMEDDNDEDDDDELEQNMFDDNMPFEEEVCVNYNPCVGFLWSFDSFMVVCYYYFIALI